MAKAGIWKGFDRARAKSGTEYFKCTIEDDGGNDRTYNIFDPGMKEVAEKLDNGSTITYALQKQGSFWNLASLDGTGLAKKPATPDPKQTKNDDVDWEQIGYEKALWGALNASISGGIVDTMEDAVRWLAIFDTLFWGIKNHKYKMIKESGKEDEDLPF